MIAEAKQVLSGFASRVPSTVLGPERVRYIAEHIQELQTDHRLMLLHLINHILAAMIDKQASDVEIGGFGAQNAVWFRIFGKKNTGY